MWRVTGKSGREGKDGGWGMGDGEWGMGGGGFSRYAQDVANSSVGIGDQAMQVTSKRAQHLILVQAPKPSETW